LRAKKPHGKVQSREGTGLSLKHRRYPSKKTFLKLPEKTKLSKHKSVKQKDEVVDRENQYIVEYPGPVRYFMAEEKIQNRVHQVKNRKPRASKCQENGNHLLNKGDDLLHLLPTELVEVSCCQYGEERE